MASRDGASDSDAGYRRDNWYDQPDEATAPEEASGGGHAPATGKPRHDAKAARLAKQILSGVAPAMCGETHTDPDRDAVELSAPEVYPPGEGSRAGPVRVNEADGYLSGGESTFVIHDGLSTEALVGVVELWLEYCTRRGRVGPDLADALRSDAQRMKQGTDMPDEKIVRRIVQDALAGERGVARDDM